VGRVTSEANYSRNGASGEVVVWFLNGTGVIGGGALGISC